MAQIDNLCTAIVANPAFRRRFQAAELSAGSELLGIGATSLLDDDIKWLLQDASVLAFGEGIHHKRLAQKANALLYELLPQQKLIRLALQFISSRLGNFPVVSSSSKVFETDNLLSLLQSPNDKDIEIDSDLAARFLQEEELSRVRIQDRDFHFNVFQAEVLHALSTKTLISFSAPTSFGKSFIVRHYIAQQFATQRVNACLVIVPTKSLIDDYFESFLRLKAQLSLPFAVYTHTRTVEAIENASIFILTQERLSYLATKSPDILRKFDIVYCDEAHCIARGYRGFLLRSVLKIMIEASKQRDRELPPTQYIFSSPIIKNPEYYHKKLFQGMLPDQVFHKEIEYSPVEKNIVLVTKRTRHFTYSLLHESMNGESFEERISQLGSNISYGSISRATSNSIDTDVAIIRHMNLQESTICYTTSPGQAHRYALALSQQLTPVTARVQDEIDDVARYIEDHFDNVFGIADLLRKGIGLHYGPMPVGLRRTIVSLFEKGVIQFIFCTPTLLEGVNLPAKNVILFSNRYGGAGGRERHTALSFWNVLGRAGRITFGLSGNVFCFQKESDEYEQLLKNQQATIDDPELHILQRKTPRSYFERTFLSSESDKFAYIKAHSRDDIEYLIFELLTSSNPEQKLRSLVNNEEFLQRTIRAIKGIQASLTLPSDILLRNPGIDPRLQEKLFEILRSQNSETLRHYFVTVPNPYAVTGDEIQGVLDLTSRYLMWPEPDDCERISNRLAQWLHETPLGRFIQQRIRYVDRNDHIKRVDLAISILRELDSEFSYRAPKYLKCFFDIARQVALEKGVPDHVVVQDRIDSFLFSVESGISSDIGKYLFETGVSRPVAIKVNFLVSDLVTIPLTAEFFRREDVVDRLRSGLSTIALKELGSHLQIEF